MVFYQLRICPGEGEAEGENQDEWFSSKREAIRRRQRVIRDRGANEHLMDLEIERVVVTDTLPIKRLLLAVLNGRGFVEESAEILGRYEAPPRARDLEDE